MRLLKSSLFIVIAAVLVFGCATTTTTPRLYKIDLTKKQKELKLHSTLGAKLLKLTQGLRVDLKIPSNVNGYLVYAVGRGTAADKAGLKQEDVIQRINGQKLGKLEQIAQLPPETTVSLEIWRKDGTKSLTATLGYRLPYLGIHVKRDDRGLLIERVSKDSPFFEAYNKHLYDYYVGLFDGKRKGIMYLRKLNQTYPVSEASLQREISRLKPREVITILVRRFFWWKGKLWEATAYPLRFTLRVGESKIPPGIYPIQVAASAPSPRTYVVDRDGSGDFKTVQGALLQSSPGDTILLRPGNYGRFDIPFSNRTIRGEDEKTAGTRVGIEGVSDVKIENLTVTDALSINKATNVSIQGLHIQGATYLAESIALYLVDSKNVSIDQCKVSRATWGIGGTNSGFKVSNSLIFNNAKRGLSIEKGSVATLESNTIVDNKEAGLGINDSQVEAYNNLFAFNPTNISCQNCNYSGGYNNLFKGEGIKETTDSEEDPLFMDHLNGDYRLRPESPLVNKGRGGTFIGAFPPVGLEPGEGEFK